MLVWWFLTPLSSSRLVVVPIVCLLFLLQMTVRRVMLVFRVAISTAFGVRRLDPLCRLRHCHHTLSSCPLLFARFWALRWLSRNRLSVIRRRRMSEPTHGSRHAPLAWASGSSLSGLLRERQRGRGKIGLLIRPLFPPLDATCPVRAWWALRGHVAPGRGGRVKTN